MALEYVDRLSRCEVEEAWALTHERFRLRLARHWAWARRFELYDRGWDLEQLIADLAVKGPEHELWEALAWVQRCAVQAHGLGGRDQWVSHGPPDLVGPDLEMVAFAPVDHPDEPRLALMLRLEGGGWKVAELVLK